RLIEIGSLEALEENHVGMLAPGRSGAAGVSCRGHALRPDAAGRSVISQKCAEVRKVRFKRIEERERFGGIDKIEVAAKAERMDIEGARNIVDQFKARLAIKIRIAPVDSGRERVRELQVRLRRDGREIK